LRKPPPELGVSDEAEARRHEEAFVNAFIEPDFRDRLLFELRAQGSRQVHGKSHRGGFIRRFGGVPDYCDHRSVITLHPPNSNPLHTRDLLTARGAGPTCYAISSSGQIDGRIVPLLDALTAAVGYGMPTILSCVPGRLAYLETEQMAGPPGRYILLKA